MATSNIAKTLLFIIVIVGGATLILTSLSAHRRRYGSSFITLFKRNPPKDEVARTKQHTALNGNYLSYLILGNDDPCKYHILRAKPNHQEGSPVKLCHRNKTVPQPSLPRSQVHSKILSLF